MTVFCKVYSDLKTFDTVEEAKGYFLMGMMNSEGSEHERYSTIYEQLSRGHKYCVDEDIPDHTLTNMEKMLTGK